MAAFTDFSNVLPDPVNIIGSAGQVDPTGTPGAGFASVKLSSTDSLLSTVTGSVRRDTRAASYHKWMIDITYHPMTREEFDPVYTFLLHRKITLSPFYVALPQYASQTSGGTTVLGNHSRGSEILNVNSTLDTVPPEIFSIGTNSKIYMITRTDTNSNYYYLDPQPGVGEERFHITPGLAHDALDSETLNFATPWFFVQQVGESINYSIDANNLYSFSLKLEEVTKNDTA